MYRTVPWSLIEIHFAGLPEPGELVSVAVALPLMLDSALFVVSKTNPPTTVMPPLAVSRPVIVVVVVTASVLLAVNVVNAPEPAVVPPIAPGAARFTFGANDQMLLISCSVYFACSGWCRFA